MAYVLTFVPVLSVKYLRPMKSTADPPLQETSLRYYLWKQMEVLIQHCHWNVVFCFADDG